MIWTFSYRVELHCEMCVYVHVITEYLLVANQRGIVSLDLNGEHQKTLISGELHTNAVDYDIRYIT